MLSMSALCGGGIQRCRSKEQASNYAPTQHQFPDTSAVDVSPQRFPARRLAWAKPFPRPWRSNRPATAFPRSSSPSHISSIFENHCSNHSVWKRAPLWKSNCNSGLLETAQRSASRQGLPRIASTHSKRGTLLRPPAMKIFNKWLGLL